MDNVYWVYTITFMIAKLRFFTYDDTELSKAYKSF